MSSKMSGRVALAIGVWLVLSVVVFGSLINVACTSNCVEIVASEDGFSGNSGGVDQIPAAYINSQQGTIERSPYRSTIERSPYRSTIERSPYYNSGFWRSSFLILPV